MRKVFEFYKTTYADVRSRGGKVILVSYTDLANQYRDRNMDILFANLAVPGAAIQEASLGRKMRILPMDDDLIKFMEGVGLSRGVIPKGSYKDVVNNDAGHPDHRHGQHHRGQRQGAATTSSTTSSRCCSATSTACARCTRPSRTSIPRTR